MRTEMESATQEGFIRDHTSFVNLTLRHLFDGHICAPPVFDFTAFSHAQLHLDGTYGTTIRLNNLLVFIEVLVQGRAPLRHPFSR